MKPKKVMFLFCGILFVFVLFAPMIKLALIKPSPVSDQIGTLSFTGKIFTCEWVSNDRKSALFCSDLGRHSVIEFDREREFSVGKSYEVKRYPPAHRLGVTQYCLEKS